MLTLLLARLKREEGQTMAEYAVVLAVVTLLVIGAITLLSTSPTELPMLGQARRRPGPAPRLSIDVLAAPYPTDETHGST